jgi:hypothetical protein
MTTPTPDNLESQLRELTTHRGEPQDLWQKALNAAGQPQSRSSWLDQLAHKRVQRRTVFAAAACLGLVVLTAFLLPSLQTTRSMAPTLLGAHSRIGPALSSSAPRGLSQGAATWSPVESNQDGLGLSAGTFVHPSPDDLAALIIRQDSASQLPSREKPTPRSVIHKSTIDLHTPDVRAAFAKASHLISTASGEFVENSSLTGDGKTAQANLTLRVAATRLSEVLNQLRELGAVQAERTTGEDVTSQVVDLEARLRNEQRIEKELLELLDKRADAPLKDILELRSSLSTVRQTIEQYIAQRDRLSHLVSLASILVVIRAEPETDPKPEPAQSILTYFQNTIAGAWHNGLRSLSDSISWLISLLISGTLWWLILAASLYTILRYRRRLAARCV